MTSRVERAQRYGLDELRRTFRDPATPDDTRKAEARAPHLAVRRKGMFVSRWPLRGANREGRARFLRGLDTVAEKAAAKVLLDRRSLEGQAAKEARVRPRHGPAEKATERAEQAAESGRMGAHVGARCW